MKGAMRLMMSLFLLVMFCFSGCSKLNHAAFEGTDETSVAVSSRDSATVVLSVTGKGIPPENSISRGQAILMGERAAVADGYRKLVEKVRGVFIEAYSRVGSGSVDQDVIQAETQAWLRGAEVLKVEKMDNDIYEAYMRLRISVDGNHVLWSPLKSMADSM